MLACVSTITSRRRRNGPEVVERGGEGHSEFKSTRTLLMGMMVTVLQRVNEWSDDVLAVSSRRLSTVDGSSLDFVAPRLQYFGLGRPRVKRGGGGGEGGGG